MINFRGKEERLTEVSSLLTDGMCAHTCVCARAYGTHMHTCGAHVYVCAHMHLWCARTHTGVRYMHVCACLVAHVHAVCACMCTCVGGTCVCADWLQQGGSGWEMEVEPGYKMVEMYDVC